MQILLHADPHTDGSRAMAEHLEAVVQDAMRRFGERITRVEGHLSDVDGSAKSGAGDIHCTLEARLVGLDAIVVKGQADSAHQAIDSAVRKLKRAVGAEIAKHDPRGKRLVVDMPAADDGADAPGTPAYARPHE
jgi:ribosome-associated translation inhibitor RaiA